MPEMEPFRKGSRLPQDFCRVVLIVCLSLFVLVWPGLGAPAPPSAGGLIGWWKLNEGSGNIAQDSSGYGNECQASAGGPLLWEAVGVVKTPWFNGVDEYLHATDAAKLNLTGAFTIEFWINPSQWASHASQGIVSKKKSDGEAGYVIYNNGGSPTRMCIRLGGTRGGQDVFSSSDVQTNVWQHWAITCDPAARTAVWYRNGKADSVTHGVMVGDTSSDAPFQIGRSQTWNGYFDGQLQDLKVYSRVLTAAEVLAEYKARAGDMNTARPVLPQVHWRVIAPLYPTDDVIVAGYSVQEFGAKGDGHTDDTGAFQLAMHAMARQGGGTVFVPEGRYVLRGNLIVPTGVTLRGERQKPAGGRPVRGTILMAYAGRGDAEGRPFISLKPCSGVRDMIIWYPEQTAGQITPYPFCLMQTGGDSATIEDVTLVNPYQGISMGPTNNELHFIKNVDGSPLALGLAVDFLSDTGRHESIHFNPDVWSESGLPGAPKRDGPQARWMYEHGIGIRYQRVDTECSEFDEIRGYKIGIETMASAHGLPYVHFYDTRVTDCATALLVKSALFVGITLTRCSFAGDQVGVATANGFNSTVLFHSCIISGKKMAADLNGSTGSTVLFQDCSFSGEVSRQAGAVVFVGCHFNAPGAHLLLGDGVTAATIAGCVFNGAPRIINHSESDQVRISSTALRLPALPQTPVPRRRFYGPARTQLYVVTDTPWDAKDDGTSDDTAAIQAALDAAGKAGGGVVFLPGGEYTMRGHLNVPSGVELRGVYDVPHHSVGKGSLLRVYAGRKNESGAPFIALQTGSGIRGVTVLYPEQQVEDIVPYPYTIQGQGAGIYIIDTTAINAYDFIDLATYRCDRHYVDYAAGGAFHIGIAIGGGSAGGQVCNVHFNPHYWGRSPYPDAPGNPKGWRPGMPLPTVQYVLAHFDAFHLGACEDELLWADAVCPMHRGMVCADQNGAGTSGIALGLVFDSAQTCVTLDGLAPAGMDFINTEMACYSPSQSRTFVVCNPGFTSQARFYNSLFWGEPDVATHVRGGSLLLDLGHFHTYGPFEVDGGAMSLVGASLGASAGPIPTALSVRGAGKLNLTANLSQFGLSADAETPAGAVTRTDENELNTPVPRGAREILVMLGRVPRSRGLVLRQQDGESENVPSSRGGRECWESIRQLHGGVYYMYFLVEFPGFESGGARHVTATVQYFDAGKGQCSILYDSSDPTVRGIPSYPGAWKSAGKFNLEGTNTWKTYSFTVDDALFEHRCNGGDIRLDFHAGTVPPAVASMVIRRYDRTPGKKY